MIYQYRNLQMKNFEMTKLVCEAEGLYCTVRNEIITELIQLNSSVKVLPKGRPPVAPLQAGASLVVLITAAVLIFGQVSLTFSESGEGTHVFLRWILHRAVHLRYFFFFHKNYLFL